MTNGLSKNMSNQQQNLFSFIVKAQKLLESNAKIKNNLGMFDWILEAKALLNEDLDFKEKAKTTKEGDKALIEQANLQEPEESYVEFLEKVSLNELPDMLDPEISNKIITILNGANSVGDIDLITLCKRAYLAYRQSFLNAAKSLLNGVIYDDTSSPKTLTEYLNKNKELRKVVDSLKTPQATIEGILSDLGVIGRGNTILFEIREIAGKQEGISNIDLDDLPKPLLEPRKETAQFYHFDPDNTKTKRQKNNVNAVMVVREFENGNLKLDEISNEQKEVLGRYTGTGGNLLDIQTGKRGSDYEYYTPKPIAESVWGVMGDLGFMGGKVLDPCAGIGIFGATAPQNAAIDAVELDQTSGTINKMINESISYNVTVTNYEKVASSTPDEIYDAVVANVPFGNNTKRGRNKVDDLRFKSDSLEYYFILRTLQKLKGGGLAAFIVPDRCITGRGKKAIELRQASSLLAEFLGAYRLPNAVFGSTDADVITCVMFFRKFRRPVLDKVDQFFSSDPSVLNEANVLWSPFVDGKYYTTAEGKRVTLGDEFVKSTKTGMYARDELTTKDDVATIAGKMLKRKLPKSRIDWKMLEEEETETIVYSDGDTISQNGQLLQLVDGAWQAIESEPTQQYEQELLANVQTPYNAFVAGIGITEVDNLFKYMKEMSLMLDVPKWMTSFRTGLAGKKPEDRELFFKPILIGMCVQEILESEGYDKGVNYREKYLDLSVAMENNAVVANKVKGIQGDIKTSLEMYKMNYKRSTGFSAAWLGVVAENEQAVITPDLTIEGLIYKNQSKWVEVGELQGVLGADFDPLTDDNYCISSDGQKFCLADDYYVGNYGDFLNQIDLDIAKISEGPIKDKLINQRKIAMRRINHLDTSTLTFNLFSPYVTLEEKAEFLRREIHSSARVVDLGDGKKEIQFNVPKNIRDSQPRTKLYNRLAAYMKSGNVSLAGIDMGNQTKEEVLKELRDLINNTNDVFHNYVHSNTRITERLEATANNPQNLRFIQAEDSQPLVIKGMNPDLKLHDYQNAFVRKMSREFSGINGFDVGLGKTFAALAAVQYVQSIGVKKRTIFVVPSSVLSNFKKEASFAYQKTDDCLFVGLRENKNGKMVTDSKFFDEDLYSIPTLKPSKIFMSFEAFERIKLKKETIDDFEKYIRSVDSSFAETDSRKEEEGTQGQLSKIADMLDTKTGSAPFLENLGIDSVVIDEAHAYKNSSNLREFIGGKFLSVGKVAKRGVDAQAKAWYIRGESPLKDGVLLLTATPITNSPLEVYSMMSLAVGHERVNNMAMNIKGADDFMNAVCKMEDEAQETIDGLIKNQRVFTGLNNAAMLRGIIADVATIKTAEDVGAQIVVPDQDIQAVAVDMDQSTVNKLEIYKNAYRFARDLDKGTANFSSPEATAYEYVKKKYGESDEVLGHPFNLINKITMLIADPDLDSMYTRYAFAEDQVELVDQVVQQWNSKKPTEERAKLSVYTLEQDYKEKVKTNKDTGDEVTTYTVSVRAWRDSEYVYIDSTIWTMQERFEDMADKKELTLNCIMSTKMAAMFEQIKKENAHVRGIGKDGNKAAYAKQIIFCDILGLHNKIRKLLVTHLGLSQSQIAIVTGQRNNDAVEILDVQNNFNDYGDDNYRIIIANKKAEVGINLQIGTQAIHHYTIGWTPDSLHQRNGRGVRQGNKTETVATYFYDASGTFDVMKRNLVDNKADWINILLDQQGANTVDIVGGMSSEQLKALIDHMGSDSSEAFQAEIRRNEQLRNEEQNRLRQRGLINTVLKQQEFIKNNESFNGWILSEFDKLLNMKESLRNFEAKISPSKKSQPSERVINSTKYAIETEKTKIKRQISALADAVIYKTDEGEIIDSIEVIERVFNSDIRINSRPYEKIQLLSPLYIVNGSFQSLTSEFNETSTMFNSWQFEIDSAKGFLSKTVEDFKERSKVNNSIDESFIKEFIGDDPSGRVSDEGYYYSSRCFARVFKDDKSQFLQFDGRNESVRTVYNDVARDLMTVSRFFTSFKNFEIIYPNSDQYYQCCKHFAEYEDSIQDTALSSVQLTYFSSLNPEILQFRKVTELVGFSINSYQLSGKYFSQVLFEDDRDDSEFHKFVFNEQSQVIVRRSRTDFFVKTENENLVFQKNIKLNNFQEVFDYCELHNLKISVKNDLFIPSVFSRDIQIYFRSNDKMQKVINDFIENTKDTLTEFYPSLEKLIHSQFVYLTDLDKDQKFLLDFLSTEQKDLALEKFEKLLDEEVAKNPPKEESEENSVPVNVLADISNISKGSIIRIEPNGFDTKPFMREFISYSDEIEKDHKYEKPSYWTGRFGRGQPRSAFWNKPLQQWEIPYGAWELFEIRDPELTKQCSFTVVFDEKKQS